jgi:tRNA threonylcarbamoyl adenosine modification protein (Sua5/YciO/YrdC/YwlC family)
MKKVLPGPYTFILEAGKSVPKLFQSKKKTIGIRVPNHLVVRAIVEKLGNPIVSTSVHDVDALIDYTTDPELIYENFSNKVDMVIDSGFGGIIASTVVDCSNGDIEIIREGAGPIEDL